MGLQAQYPYLQGVAVVAMEGGEKKALSGLPSQNPWNIFDFAERPTSITRQLLKICEAACSPHAIRIVEEKLASENKVKKKKGSKGDTKTKKIKLEQKLSRAIPRLERGGMNANVYFLAKGRGRVGKVEEDRKK